MARGMRHGGTSTGGEDSNIKKIFWTGLVDGISWSLSRKLPDSDSRANYSVDSRINTSTSGYYGEMVLVSTQIDVTNYSKLKLTIPVGSGGGDKIIGITNNTGLNKTYTKSISIGASNYTIDISNLSGIYYIKIYQCSGNRSSNSVQISHIWLE